MAVVSDTSPSLLSRCLSLQFSAGSQVFSDSCRDEGGAVGVTRAGIAPMPFGDRVGVAQVVSAFGAECPIGGGVGAGFGEDVAPIAARVCPGAQVERLVLGEA